MSLGRHCTCHCRCYFGSPVIHGDRLGTPGICCRCGAECGAGLKAHATEGFADTDCPCSFCQDQRRQKLAKSKIASCEATGGTLPAGDAGAAADRGWSNPAERANAATGQPHDVAAHAGQSAGDCDECDRGQPEPVLGRQDNSATANDPAGVIDHVIDYSAKGLAWMTTAGDLSKVKLARATWQTLAEGAFSALKYVESPVARKLLEEEYFRCQQLLDYSEYALQQLTAKRRAEIRAEKG